MKKAIITNKGNVSFVDGPLAASTTIEIIGEKNIKEVDLSDMSEKEFNKLKKEKDPKKKLGK